MVAQLVIVILVFVSVGLSVATICRVFSWIRLSVVRHSTERRLASLDESFSRLIDGADHDC